MSYRRIGLTDIAYYGKRMTVFEPPKKFVTDDGQVQMVTVVGHYRVKQLQVEKIQEQYIGKKKVTTYGAPISLKEVFPRIKMVYDSDGVLIARRKAMNQPLRVTGKGMSQFIQLS